MTDCNTDPIETKVKANAKQEDGIDETTEQGDDFVPEPPDDMDEENKDAKEEEKPFECKECSKTFARQKGLSVHSLVHKQKPVCKICNKRFTCRSVKFLFRSLELNNNFFSYQTV